MKHYTFLLATLVAAASCNNDITGLEPPSDPSKETFVVALGVNISAMTKTGSGVYYLDQVVGTGIEVTDKTDSVVVTYAGYLKDGKLIDSGSNARFVLAAVIPGFKAGMIGMREGGKRKLVIPSALGYAGVTQRKVDGSITIPRQSTLVFDVELQKVHNPAPPAP